MWTIHYLERMPSAKCDSLSQRSERHTSLSLLTKAKPNRGTLRSMTCFGSTLLDVSLASWVFRMGFPSKVYEEECRSATVAACTSVWLTHSKIELDSH